MSRTIQDMKPAASVKAQHLWDQISQRYLDYGPDENLVYGTPEWERARDQYHAMFENSDNFKSHAA